MGVAYSVRLPYNQTVGHAGQPMSNVRVMSVVALQAMSLRGRRRAPEPPSLVPCLRADRSRDLEGDVAWKVTW